MTQMISPTRRYLLGAANPETLRMAAAIRRHDPSFHLEGMLDNDEQKWGTDFHGIPVLGGIGLVETLAGPDALFTNLITGCTRVRHKTTKEILTRGGILGNFIHPTVDLCMTEIGVGLYLQEAVVVQAEVRLGDNTSIHTNAVIGHETEIGKSVFIAHAVSISGCCLVGDGSFIGTNATILPRITIGRWATIGAGAVVTKDVPDYAVVVGNPAKIIRLNLPEDQDAD